MQIINLNQTNISTLAAEALKRPELDAFALHEKVKAVLSDVKFNGNDAVKRLTEQFDGVFMDDFVVREDEIKFALDTLDSDLKIAIQQAAANIEKFHAAQLQESKKIETMPGVTCWRKSIGIEKVGLYIPGGTAPLFSTILMLAIPARMAGCKEIVLCSPPNKQSTLHPAILFAARLVGVTKIYKIGGVQAIAAMAYGTENIPKVSKIFGPGNQYVTCAKQLVQQEGTAIDMPAGPSEVCVFADETAEASFVAADLLSQAEHGSDSQVLLISTDAKIVDQVKIELDKQLEILPRREFAVKALDNSKALIVNNVNDAIDLINEYAPEHLILSCKNDEKTWQIGVKFLFNNSIWQDVYFLVRRNQDYNFEVLDARKKPWNDCNKEVQLEGMQWLLPGDERGLP